MGRARRIWDAAKHPRGPNGRFIKAGSSGDRRAGTHLPGEDMSSQVLGTLARVRNAPATPNPRGTAAARFAAGAAAKTAVARPGRAAGGSSTSPGKDLTSLNRREAAGILDALDPARRDGDGPLREIAKRQGFDAKPTVVPRKQLDDAISGGATEVFRGVKGTPSHSAAELNDQFRTGDVYFGAGTFGSGLYFSTNRSYAEEFASDGGLMRAALRPDARTIEYGELDGKMRKNFGGERDFDRKMLLGTNPGWLAALLGYDAVRVGENLVVLNRGALLVQG